MSDNQHDFFAYLSGLERFGIRFGLESITAVLEQLDNPHLNYATVHVAGTNGKGSVCAMVASILNAAGYTVGCYTSPHLVSINERIMINGQPIGDEAFVRLGNMLRGINEQIARDQPDKQLTHFEFLTTLAVMYFEERAVDIAVFEVGMGGRLDATNVIRPAAVGITSIALEHTAILGNELPTIAGEKQAIIKSPATVVTNETKKEILELLEARCQNNQAPLAVIGQEITYEPGTVFWKDGYQTLDVHGRTGHYNGLKLPLLGEHQLRNAAVAIGLVEALNERGFHCVNEAIAQGMKMIRWPGRFQFIQDEPAMLLDVAHNPQAAETFARTLTNALANGLVTGKVLSVIAILNDKDLNGVLRALVPLVETVIVTQSSSPRAIPAEELFRHTKQLPDMPEHVVILQEPSVEDALERAGSMANENDLICITGSCTTVGDALKALGISPFVISNP